MAAIWRHVCPVIEKEGLYFKNCFFFLTQNDKRLVYVIKRMTVLQFYSKLRLTAVVWEAENGVQMLGLNLSQY